MSRKPSRLEDQLLTARHELELATLLNKGVLHSLQENKITIAELQQQNTVLRAAESRLSATEDALESAEKRVRELEREVRQARVVCDGESADRERAEAELGELRTKYARLLSGLRGLVAIEDGQVDEEDLAGPGPATAKTMQVRQASRGRAVVTPVRQPSLGRKKRRIQSTPSDSPDQLAQQSILAPAAIITPVSPRRPRLPAPAAPNTNTNSGKKSNSRRSLPNSGVPHQSPKGRQGPSASREKDRDKIREKVDPQVKVEREEVDYERPKLTFMRRSVSVDSDEDPLAMG